MVTDETFLQFTGGIINNCLNNIFNAGNTIDGNNELPIIRRSSYYDFDKFNSLISQKTRKTIKYFKFKYTVHKCKV